MVGVVHRFHHFHRMMHRCLHIMMKLHHGVAHRLRHFHGVVHRHWMIHWAVHWRLHHHGVPHHHRMVHRVSHRLHHHHRLMHRLHGRTMRWHMTALSASIGGESTNGEGRGDGDDHGKQEKLQVLHVSSWEFMNQHGKSTLSYGVKHSIARYRN